VIPQAETPYRPAGNHRPTGACAGGLTPRIRGEEGFSLPELLVVMLIIGVLAAIAIPAFLSTTAKATDVQAKELVRNAETTAETIALDHGGSYEDVTTAELAKAEPTIAITASKQRAWLSNATSGANEYSITATATNGDEMTITRAATGVVSRTCRSPVLKTGCAGGENSTW
jgi:type IV pilus assembly protein PilA